MGRLGARTARGLRMEGRGASLGLARWAPKTELQKSRKASCACACGEASVSRASASVKAASLDAKGCRDVKGKGRRDGKRGARRIDMATSLAEFTAPRERRHGNGRVSPRSGRQGRQQRSESDGFRPIRRKHDGHEKPGDSDDRHKPNQLRELTDRGTFAPAAASYGKLPPIDGRQNHVCLSEADFKTG